MPAHFTDNQLARLIVELSADYENQRKVGHRAALIYQRLADKVYNALSSRDSSLFGLPISEQAKVYTVLNTFIQATANYSRFPQEELPKFFTLIAAPKQAPRLTGHGYCPAHDAFFHWLMLDSLLNRPYWGSYPYWRLSREQNNEALITIILLTLSILACALTFVSLFYLINESLNSIERFIYNEGWLQAATSIASAIAGAIASAILGELFLVAPLSSLVVTLGLSNPVGAVALGLICLSIIGAAGACFISNQVQDYLLKKYHHEAMDPQEPYRFRLIEQEEQMLEEKGLDPLKVKCAMAAIRQQMGPKPIPSLMGRIFSKKGKAIQEELELLRSLRRGELDEVQIKGAKGSSGYCFDLRPFPAVPPTYEQNGVRIEVLPHARPNNWQELEEPRVEAEVLHFPSSNEAYTPPADYLPSHHF